MLHTYIGWGESGSNFWKVKEPELVLFLFYVNVYGMCSLSHLSSQPLVIPVPWVIFHDRWSIPVISTLSDYLPFPSEEWGGDDLKPTTFSSLLLFRFFLSFLFSLLPSDIVPLSASCWGCSSIIIIVTGFRSQRQTDGTTYLLAWTIPLPVGGVIGCH